VPVLVVTPVSPPQPPTPGLSGLDDDVELHFKRREVRAEDFEAPVKCNDLADLYGVYWGAFGLVVS
jgi:hypothetical protein